MTACSAPTAPSTVTALASIVFADDVARDDLEAIVHPEVRRAIAEAVAAHADTDDVVVVDSPLLIETGAHEGFPVVVVVAASADARVARLVERGMAEADVRARMAAQMPLEEKVAVADVVVDNDGTEADLEERVDAALVGAACPGPIIAGVRTT